MAVGDTDLGTGSSLAFAGLTAELLSLSASGIERVSVSKAHMGTSGAKPFLVGDQYDPGEITAEIHFAVDQDIDALMIGAAASLTATFPVAVTGDPVEAKTVVAAVTGFSWEAPLEDVMTASVTWKITEGSP